ncbi:hypothetical protein Cgig2_012777 [Carnegiea gigantea]|uniref:Uncharacterized protein n=1 Tax=Carnegiea gigantea TaxID=171969 RepID=A0A9Q1QG55_9CARY|nr:hypothetical protein Cgig2_012777 [Carnegiea gigantea]
MTTKKRKKSPDCSFAFISLFPSAFPSRLSSRSICLLTGPSLEVWETSNPMYLYMLRLHLQMLDPPLQGTISRQDWINIYSDAFVTSGPFTCSYHSYVYLHTSAPSPATKRPPFRFQPNWNHYGDVHSILKKKWSMRVNGSLMFCLAQCLKAIKKDLKRWNSIKFANYGVQIKKNMTQLHYVENKLLESLDNHRLNNWHVRLIKQREKLMLFNQRYWRHYACKQWLVYGDRTSHFFTNLLLLGKDDVTLSVLRIRQVSGLTRLNPSKTSLFSISLTDLKWNDVPLCHFLTSLSPL